MPLGLPAFPSSAGGATTETVGFFDATPVELADWFSSGDGALGQQRPGWKGLPDVTRDLAPTDVVTARAFVPLGRWTLLLTNGPSGTDLGVLPSQATRALGCLAIRAVWSDRRDAPCPAVLIEVFGPDGEPPLMARRSVAVAADGERWVVRGDRSSLPLRAHSPVRRTAQGRPLHAPDAARVPEGARRPGRRGTGLGRGGRRHRRGGDLALVTIRLDRPGGLDRTGAGRRGMSARTAHFDGLALV